MQTPVLWIRDILVRIRIRGSAPLTCGPDPAPDPAFFNSGCQMPTKKIFIKVFLLILFEGTLTSVFKAKNLKRSKKIVEINVFLTLFVC
jgi:hypothetical protein